MTTSKTNELKPCPFCGGKDIRFSNKTASAGKNRHVMMYCNNCHAYGARTVIPMKDKKYLLSAERETFGIEVAIKEWNQRYDQ